jgi:hypothetical protein
MCIKEIGMFAYYHATIFVITGNLIEVALKEQEDLISATNGRTVGVAIVLKKFIT